MDIPKDTLQKDLFDQLSNGTLPPKIFLQKVLELDQQSGVHANAKNNEQLLINEQVKSLCCKSDPDGYYNVLSITYCHLAQQSSFFDHNQVLAKDYFKKANIASSFLLAGDWGLEWANYISASYCYFAKDINGIEKALSKMGKEGVNKKIVQNLLKGLTERGDIDYRTDYTAHTKKS